MSLTKDLTPHKDLQNFFSNLTWTRKIEDPTGKMGDTTLKQNALQYFRSQISVYNMLSKCTKKPSAGLYVDGQHIQGRSYHSHAWDLSYECPETTKPPLDLPFPHI
jgi:hypothetical protein